MATKNSRPECAFIIPTLTNKSGLENLIRNISNYYPQFPLIIVNNGDRFQAFEDLHVRNIKNRVVILNQGRNTGFDKACNDGSVKAEELFSPQYLVFLNDDALFTEDWLRKCLDALKKNRWFATSPVLVDLKGRVENAGFVVLPRGKVELITDPEDKRKPDGISATALVINADKFNELGRFDERFFAYLEDVDLFLRAKKRSLRFGVTKNARVIHEGQKTSSKFKTRKAWLDFKNWILVIWKNWSREELKQYWWSIMVERLRNLSGVIKSLL